MSPIYPQRSQRLARQREKFAIAPAMPETRAPYLPPEIIVLVGTQSQKSDLKNLRLVSKAWSALVTHLLFDQVYVSPRNKDLEVFRAITSHPSIRSSVKRILYDVCTFNKMSKLEYFRLMCREFSYLRPSFRNRNSTDFRGQEGLAQLVNAEADGEVEHLYVKYRDKEMVTKGFAQWDELVREERVSFKSDAFLKDLFSGLSQLANLQSVKMDDDIWGRGRRMVSSLIETVQLELPFGPKVEGSPLSRNWKPFHPYPRKPDHFGFNSRESHLLTMMGALPEAKRKIRHFEDCAHVVEGVSSLVFQEHILTDNISSKWISSLCNLSTFRLKISPRPQDARGAQILGFLPRLLDQMTSLKSLKLILTSSENVRKEYTSWSRDFEEACCTYNNVFPRAGRWPQLTTFYLAGLAITAGDLRNLLFRQMPSLTTLWLRHIDLQKGQWESVVAFLGSRPHWELLSLQGIFRHQDGQWWPCHPDNEQEESEKLSRYTDYIFDRPSLPANCDDASTVAHVQEWCTQDAQNTQLSAGKD